MTGKPLHILIAEDDILLSIGIEAMVMKLGHHILSKCSSGKELIEKAEHLDPDLIIADIMLSDTVTGIEAVKEVLSHKPGISVIYVTADSDPQLRELAREETGFVDFFTKPIELEKFKQAIQTKLN